MINRPSKKWLGSAGAVAILISLVLAANWLLVRPIVTSVDSRKADLARLEQEAETLRAIIGERGLWEAARDASKTDNAGLGILLATGSPSSVQADTLTRTAELAAGSGLIVLSTEARSPERKGALVRVPIVVRAEGTDEQLASFLANATQHRPMFIIERLSVRPAQSGSDAVERLQCEFTLVALLQEGV